MLLHLYTFFRVSIAALGPSSQTQSHGTPHAFCKYFIQKKVNPSVSIYFSPFCMSLHDSRLMSLFRLLKRNRRNIVLVSHPLILSTVSTVHGQDCIDVVNQSSALHLPRNVFALGYQNLFPKGFVCRLHSFSNGIVRFSLPVHDVAQDPELLFKRKFVASRCGADRHINPLFWIIRASPPQTRRLGYQIPSACFFNQIPQHLLQIFLMRHDPKDVGPHEAAFLSCSFIFEVHENTHSFLYPFFFHIRQELGWPFCHKRGASTLPWRKHRLKTKLLSTHSNVALLSSSDISRRWAAINHPCVPWFSMILMPP